MITKIGRNTYAFISMFIIFVLLAFDASAMSVIVNPQSRPSNIELTTYQLRQIYTMRKRTWENGDVIVVFVLPSQSELHQKFSTQVLKVFPYQLDRIWRKLAYSGLGKMPQICSSIIELKKSVMSTPGAIGYVDQINEGEAVNVIKIKS